MNNESTLIPLAGPTAGSQLAVAASCSAGVRNADAVRSSRSDCIRPVRSYGAPRGHVKLRGMAGTNPDYWCA